MKFFSGGTSAFSRKIFGLLLLVFTAHSHAVGNAANDYGTDILSGASAPVNSMAMNSAPHVLSASDQSGSHEMGQQGEEMNGVNGAIAAAVADGMSTGLAISSGAVELNPLIPTSPIGLLAITGLKIGLAKYAENLPEHEKRLTLKTSSALWGGAAFNNLMVLMAAPPPVPVIAGVIMGVVTWMHMEKKYQKHDALIASRKARTPIALANPVEGPNPEDKAILVTAEAGEGRY